VGVNGPQMMEADQVELRNSIEMIERVAKDTQFETKALLHGSKGANGVAIGDSFYFVSAGEGTKNSPTSENLGI
jgi:flagellin-like hook-associated protein FlgL